MSILPHSLQSAIGKLIFFFWVEGGIVFFFLFSIIYKNSVDIGECNFYDIIFSLFNSDILKLT